MRGPQRYPSSRFTVFRSSQIFSASVLSYYCRFSALFIPCPPRKQYKLLIDNLPYHNFLHRVSLTRVPGGSPNREDISTLSLLV